MSARRALVAALFSVASLAPLALTAPAAARPPRLELGAGFGFGKSDRVGNVIGITPELTFELPIDDRASLVLDWGLTYLSSEAQAPLAKSAIALEDPFLGLELVAVSDDVTLRFRPGITLPLASLTDDPNKQPAQSVAFNMAHGTFGMRSLWRYLPENIALVGTSEIETGAGDSGRFRFWLDGAFALPTTDSDPDSDFIIETGIGFTFAPLFADLSFVWIPSNGGDNAQVAFRPGLRFSLGGVGLEIAANLNLDDPFASFGDSGVLAFDARLKFALGGGSSGGYHPQPEPPTPIPEPPTPIPEPPTPIPEPPTPGPTDFKGVLRAVVDAFPNDFNAIKSGAGRQEGFGTTWTSSVCLPGAKECSVYLGMLASHPNWYAVMLETTDEAEATRLYESLVAQVGDTPMPFTKVKMDDSRQSSLWTQGFLPFGPGAGFEDITFSVERVSNPVMKVGDRYVSGWNVYVRVEHVPSSGSDDDEDY